MSRDAPVKYLELEKGLHIVACSLGTEVCALWFTRLISVPSLLEFNTHSSLPSLYGCLTSASDCLLKIATNCSSLPFKSLLGRLESQLLYRKASACWVFTEHGREKTPKTQFLLFLVKKDILCFAFIHLLLCVCVYACVHKGHTLFVCEGQRTACWEPALS